MSDKINSFLQDVARAGFKRKLGYISASIKTLNFHFPEGTEINFSPDAIKPCHALVQDIEDEFNDLALDKEFSLNHYAVQDLQNEIDNLKTRFGMDIDLGR